MYLMPDCWLEVNLHQEGSASGELGQVFPCFVFGPTGNAVLVPKFHVALHASHSALPMLISKFLNIGHSMLNKISTVMQPFQP
jgi:hypothetical protein